MRREEGREGGRKRWVLSCIYCLGVMEEGGREEEVGLVMYLLLGRD